MPFGKYRAYEIADLPDDYIAWLLTIRLHGHLFDAVYAESRSQQSQSSRNRSGESGLLTLKVRAVDVPLMREIIDRGYRAVAKVHHPDAGGSDAAMQRVNVLADSLRSQLSLIEGCV